LHARANTCAPVMGNSKVTGAAAVAAANSAGTRIGATAEAGAIGGFWLPCCSAFAKASADKAVCLGATTAAAVAPAPATAFCRNERRL